jgi:peptidyl-prolyl cis-trans isomerase C
MNYKKYLIGLASLAIIGTVGCAEKNDKTEAPKENKEAIKTTVADTIKTTAETVKPALESAKPAPESAPAPAKPLAALPGASGDSKPLTIDEFMAKQNIPDVIATIGDEKITKADLIKDIKASIPPQMQSQPLPPQILASLAGNFKMIADQMVNRKIIMKLATDAGFTPSEDLVEKQFKSTLKDMSKEDKESANKQLAAKGSSIEKEIEKAKKDIKVQKSAAIKEWVDTKIMPEFKIAEADAKKFYDDNIDKFKKPGTVKVAHILIAPETPDKEKLAKMSDEEKKEFSAKADADAKTKANDILKQVKDGGDFAKLAAEYSKCPSGKQKGGELSEFDKTGAVVNSPGGGKMVKPFTDASFSLNKKGDISPEIVKTSFGYHIIKLLDKKVDSTTPFKDVQKLIEQNLTNEKIGKKIDELINAEKKKLNVQIFVK